MPPSSHHRVFLAIVLFAIGLSANPAADGDPVERERLYKEALNYVRARNFEMSTLLAKFQAVLEADPSHPENDLILLLIADALNHGELYGGKRDRAGAVAVLQTLIEKFPETRKSVTQARINMATIYNLTDQTQKAREAYQAVIDLDLSGTKWNDNREWMKQRQAGLSWLMASTLRVKRSPEATLLNLSQLNKKYADRPEVLAGIEKYRLIVVKQMAKKTIRALESDLANARLEKRPVPSINISASEKQALATRSPEAQSAVSRSRVTLADQADGAAESASSNRAVAQYVADKKKPDVRAAEVNELTASSGTARPLNSKGILFIAGGAFFLLFSGAAWFYQRSHVVVER